VGTVMLKLPLLVVGKLVTRISSGFSSQKASSRTAEISGRVLLSASCMEPRTLKGTPAVMVEGTEMN